MGSDRGSVDGVEIGGVGASSLILASSILIIGPISAESIGIDPRPSATAKSVLSCALRAAGEPIKSMVRAPPEAIVEAAFDELGPKGALP